MFVMWRYRPCATSSLRGGRSGGGSPALEGLGGAVVVAPLMTALVRGEAVGAAVLVEVVGTDTVDGFFTALCTVAVFVSPLSLSSSDSDPLTCVCACVCVCVCVCICM
jgi:hypothetical protein